MTNHKICYNFNIFKPDICISHKAGINIEISIAITDLWKNIHKKVFIRNKKKVNKVLNNTPAYNHLSNVATSKIGRFEPKLTIKLNSNFVAFYFFDALPL